MKVADILNQTSQSCIT